MAIRKDLNIQFLLTVPNELGEEIEEYWHKERLANRNEGVRELIKLGLEAYKKENQGREN